MTYPHLVPISQDPDQYPMPIRQELCKALKQGQLTLIDWAPNGGHLNQGRLLIVIEQNGMLLWCGGGGWIGPDDQFRFDNGMENFLQLHGPGETELRQHIASLNTFDALSRLAPINWIAMSSGNAPQRRWFGNCGDEIVFAWLDDVGLHVRLGFEGAVVGPIAGLTGDDLTLEVLRRAGVLQRMGKDPFREACHSSTSA